MSTVRLWIIGLQYCNKHYRTLVASSLSNMNAQSVHAHLLHSLRALWENGCHDMLFHQHAINDFLVKVGNSAGVIYKWLCGVYGDAYMVASSVRRWVKHFKDRNTDITNQPHCCQLVIAVTECSKQKVIELIRQEQRITVTEIATQLGAGHHVVQEMMEILGYQKVCSHWVPCCLWVQRNTKRLGTALPSTLQSRFGPLRPLFCSGPW